ncbi:polycomb protein Pcl [Toxorhynchites rutilus septentrionalis]|uniref:polycomb protein Pcl n=1 Tax=Toxorhynchites rutilus septentrionalis TaxID=329112 RepID=UPI00247A9BFC|nr:polycomb protein Pcl [Toxorhynchites rutilus septentrionalis]
MSTSKDGFLTPTLSSTSISTGDYGHPTKMVDKPLVSIETSSTSNDAVDDKYCCKQLEESHPGGGQTKQQIIIHEFLNGHSGPFINHHHPAPVTGDGSPSSTINNSSITILTSHQTNSSPNASANVPKRSTMVVDRINICINNHFNEPPQPNVGTENGPIPTPKAASHKRSSTDLEPDSTTSSLGQLLPVTPEKNSGEYKLQEDVLVENKDGRFYLGTIIAIGNSQCLVRFNDNTECWSDFRELTKLSSGEADASPACVVCKQYSAENSVEVCENCGRGYHVKCMDESFERNGYWFCRMCTSPNGKRRDIRYVCSGVLSESLDPLCNKSQLPYDIESLTWDPQHRINSEQRYCYCGQDGDWLREMIQCSRCQQWFHGRCIRSLQYPIFLGDRFYFFICSICNHGHEFVRRLDISWPDLIHLTLYNLIARNGKRFYDVTKAIAPYVEDNWKTLQLSDQMSKLSPNARKEIMTQTLTNDRIRFKCGTEVKKAGTMWTLRSAQPPNPPNVLLQAGQIITEHILTHMSRENKVFRFLPRVALEKSFVNDAASREKMTGVTYCSPLVSEEDDTSEISDDTNQDEDSSDYDAPAGAGTAELAIGRDGGDLVVLNNDQARLNNVAIYASTGKTVSSNLSDSLFSSNAKDGFQLFGTNNGAGSKPQSETGSVTSGNGNRRAFKSRPKKAESEKSFDVYDSSDDTSRNTLDLIIPPPKDFTGKNNPFHQPATAAVATAIGTNGSGPALLVRNNETKDLMQKASTSNVSHRSSSNLVNGELRVARIVKRRLSARDIMNGAKIKRRKFRKSSVIGTTIAAIPPPGSHSVASQPSSSLIATLFSQPVDNGGWTSQISLSHLLPSTSSSGSSTPASCSYPPTSIQPNSMVPQALPNLLTTSTTSSSSSSACSVQTAPSQPGLVPKRSPAHGRRLRQRQERNYAESTRKTSSTSAVAVTANDSPVKVELPVCLDGSATSATTATAVVATTTSTGSDLQSSLNLYFGATHRIMSGEKFVVKGKRVSLSGKVQYLIEWEGCPTQIM